MKASELADELESKMRARRACKTEAAADTFTHEIGLIVCGEPDTVLTALRRSPRDASAEDASDRARKENERWHTIQPLTRDGVVSGHRPKGECPACDKRGLGTIFTAAAVRPGSAPRPYRQCRYCGEIHWLESKESKHD